MIPGKPVRGVLIFDRHDAAIEPKLPAMAQVNRATPTE